MLVGNQNPIVSSSLTQTIKSALASGESVVNDSVGSSTGIPSTDLDSQTLNVLNATNEILDAASDISERLANIEETYMTTDTSSIEKEMLYISSLDGVPFVELSKVPKGQVITMVVHMGDEDLVVDGTYNMYVGSTGKTRVEIPSIVENPVGQYCSIVYLI